MNGIALAVDSGGSIKISSPGCRIDGSSGCRYETSDSSDTNNMWRGPLPAHPLPIFKRSKVVCDTFRKSFQFQTTAVQGVAFGQSTRPVGVHSVNARLCLLSTKFVRWQSDTELGEKVFIFCRKGWSDKILVFICQIPYATHIRETLNVPYLNIFILFYDQRVT
jgi:hypothetical protein